MGADVTKESGKRLETPEYDCFRRRVLLIRPPQDIAEKIGARERRLFRSVLVTLVVWHGERLRPEQWLSVMGNHLCVLYFFDTLVDSTPETAENGMTVCLKEVRSFSVDVPVYGICLAKEPPVNYAATCEECKASYVPLESPELVDTFMAAVTLKLCPPEIRWPLSVLLKGLMEGCGAKEGYLIDSTQYLPIVHVKFGEEAAPSTVPAFIDTTLNKRVCSLCDVVRTRLVPILEREHTDIHYMSVCCEGARILMGWACRPYSLVILICQQQDHVVTGNKVYEGNLEHFTLHFSNVVNNTTLSKRFRTIK